MIHYIVYNLSQIIELKKLAHQYFDIHLKEVCNQMISENRKQLSTSKAHELKKWPILELLDSEFKTQVRMALVFRKYFISVDRFFLYNSMFSYNTLNRFDYNSFNPPLQNLKNNFHTQSALVGIWIM